MVQAVKMLRGVSKYNRNRVIQPEFNFVLIESNALSRESMLSGSITWLPLSDCAIDSRFRTMMFQPQEQVQAVLVGALQHPALCLESGWDTDLTTHHSQTCSGVQRERPGKLHAAEHLFCHELHRLHV